MLPNWLYGKSKSKLADILGGGGGTPADYDQVKAQVNQNAEDITALLDNLEVNGAVNMLPNNATTQTINGVTFTVNSNGSITISGTATESANLEISDITPSLAGTSLIMSDGSTSTSIYMFISYILNGSTQYITDKTFTIPNNSTDIKVYIHVNSNYSGNITVYPMIRLASITDDTYVPYAKTNNELTDDVANITKQSGGLISYGIGNWTDNSTTIILPRRGGLLVGGRNGTAFAIYICENINECAVLIGSDFVTATISDLTLSLTFTRHFGSTFNYKYINSLVGQI